MSHFAKIENNIVTQVIVAEEDFISSQEGQWIQTSYNTRGGIHYASDTGIPDNGVALRGNYAGIGYIYDSTHDVFYPPQPFPSWTISAPTWTWTSPVAMPTDGQAYSWNEANQSWEVVSGT